MHACLHTHMQACLLHMYTHTLLSYTSSPGACGRRSWLSQKRFSQTLQCLCQMVSCHDYKMNNVKAINLDYNFLWPLIWCSCYSSSSSSSSSSFSSSFSNSSPSSSSSSSLSSPSSSSSSSSSSPSSSSSSSYLLPQSTPTWSWPSYVSENGFKAQCIPYLGQRVHICRHRPAGSVEWWTRGVPVWSPYSHARFNHGWSQIMRPSAKHHSWTPLSVRPLPLLIQECVTWTHFLFSLACHLPSLSVHLSLSFTHTPYLCLLDVQFDPNWWATVIWSFSLHRMRWCFPLLLQCMKTSLQLISCEGIGNTPPMS